MATKTSKMEKNVESILKTVIFIKKKVEGIDERVDGLDTKVNNLDTKVNKIDKKLDVFAKHEVSERVQLGERVGNIEKHVGIKRPTTV